MPIVIFLTPITERVTSLCGIIHAKSKRLDAGVNNVLSRAIPIRKNIIGFVSSTPHCAQSIGDWRCKRCSSDKFVVRKENRVCLHCGESSYYEASGAISAALSSSHRKYNANASKRLTHFKNWLNRIQGKERCTIRAEEMDKIRQIVADFPSSYSEHDSIRAALKQLGLQKYYNNVYYIMRHVYGYALVDFRKINEARLVAMFLRIQEPFARAQTMRTNMVSYLFLIRKFCELLGYSVAQYIPLLKSRPNLQRQDLIWKSICDELGLPFYPSV
jgi:hypothetical protein